VPAALPPQRIGRSLQSAVVFGLGNGLQRMVAFLLLPLYTRALTPAQYGALSVLLAVSSAAGIVFAFGQDMGLFRSFFQYADDPDLQRRFLGSVWRFLIVVPVVLSGVLAAAAVPLVAGIAQVTPFDVFLALLAGAFYVAGSAVPMVVLRVHQRLRAFMLLAAVNAVSTPLFTLALVVWTHHGITGWLIASAASNLVVVIAALFIVPWERGVPFDRPVVIKALRFGANLIPHAFALWALLLIDRGILAAIISAHQLGIYSLAANLGVPVGVAISSLNQAMLPAYAAAGADPDRRAHLADIVVIQILGLLVIVLGGALLGGPVLILLAAPAYHAAAPLVIWIVLGYGFLGLYYIPMNGITIGAGKSNFVWVVSAFGAASDVALLLVLVPGHGVTAAAIASGAAYAVLFAGICVFAHRPENPVRYRWSRLLPAGVVASLFYVAARLTTPDSGGASIGLRLAWTVGFAAICATVYRIGPQLRTRWQGRFARG
jgi:O-antigen/teichoic acid export membrane protein